VTINQGAGVIVASATPLELKRIAEYLRAIQVTIERQVMIEAKIVEVTLTKSTAMGINWAAFRGLNSGGHKVGVFGSGTDGTLAGTGAISGATTSGTTGTLDTTVPQLTGKGFYGLAVQSASFSALLSFLETQGDVQVLSSPRIATLNNQKAVLKVGADVPYLDGVYATTTTTATGSITTPNYAVSRGFAGIALDVTPQIDATGLVMLHVHPSKSDVSTVSLPTPGAVTGNELPTAKLIVSETDSIVRVRDGQIIAIGGLMQQSANHNSDGVPVLGDLPIIGSLFKYRNTDDAKSELVFLIKPTIVTDDGTGSDPEMPETPLLDTAKQTK
jgi:MSHA biogenesis protein MshL